MRYLLLTVLFVLSNLFLSVYSQENSSLSAKEKEVLYFKEKAQKAGISDVKADLIIFMNNAFQKKAVLLSKELDSIKKNSLIKLYNSGSVKHYMNQSFLYCGWSV